MFTKNEGNTITRALKEYEKKRIEDTKYSNKLGAEEMGRRIEDIKKALRT